MAQVYNPSTGQWEDDDTENTSLSGNAGGAIFNGAPDLGVQQIPTGGSTMSGGTPWQGAQVGLGDLYTQYDLPDSPGKYGIRDKAGNEMGFGYKPWDQAISDFAYQRGRTGSEGAWGHSALTPTDYSGGSSGFLGMGGSGVDETGASYGGYGGPAPTAPTFATEDALKAALSGTGYDRIDSLEKYHRAITDMQRSEVLGQMLTNPSQSTVPDWTYHRDLGVHNQTPESITGENALYGGSQPVFKDGKLIGYQVDVSPMSGMESHNDYIDPNAMGGADKSGAVTSGSYLSRKYNDSTGSAYDMGDGNAFVSADKVKDFAGWTNNDSSYYNKESNGGFGSFLKIALPVALMAIGGMGAAGMFAGEAAGAAGGLTAGEMAAATGFSDLASMGAAGGTWGGFGGTLGGGFVDALGGMTDFSGSALPSWASGEAGNFATGLDSLFNTQGFSGADFVGGGNNFNALDTAFNGAGSFGQGAEALSNTMPTFAPDVSGVVEGVDPFATTEGVNKGFSKLTGYGMNDPYGKGISGLPVGTEGEIKNMYNTMTQPMGGGARGPSPLDALYKGGKAFMDYRSNQDAMDMYKKQLNLATAGADPNRGRGNTANDLWTQNWQDPQAGMAEFMGGAGRKFIDQARAAAAKGGNRGSYLNSGKINSDLASLYLQNQNARGNALSQGFERPSNTNAQVLNSMAPILEMKKNEYAPFGQAIDYIRRGTDLASGAKGLKDIYDLISGW